MLKIKDLLITSALCTSIFMAMPAVSNAAFEDAVKAYEAGDYQAALKEWTTLAEKNDPAAMRNLGHLYRRGLGTEQNFERAMHWYKRAANMGFARAQANVASMYLRGQGVDQDFVKAAEWLKKAGRNGHAIAQYNLGLMYEHGKGVEKSATKALAWFNLAAKAGHPKALNKLSVLVAKNPELKETEVEEASNEAMIKEAPKVEPAKETKAEVAKVEPKKAEPKKITPAPVQKVEPKPVVKKVEPAPKVVAAQPKPKTEAKKFDPFAGSANNPNAAKENTGAPTAFNTKKAEPAPKVMKKVEPRIVETPKAAEAPRQIVEPVKPAEVVVAPVKEQAAPKEVVVQTAPVETAPAPAKDEAVVLAKPTEAPKVAEAPKAAEEPKAVVAKTKPATRPAEQEESKGFFSSLKSLIMGDDKEEETAAPSIPAASVATAPASAIQAPTPAPNIQAQTIIPGSGLSVPERLEMANLSYAVEDYQQALSVWAPLAQEGNAEAQFYLGRMFYEGYAVPVDRVKAHYWWSQAKSNGFENATRSLDRLEATLTFLEKRRIQGVN